MKKLLNNLVSSFILHYHSCNLSISAQQLPKQAGGYVTYQYLGKGKVLVRRDTDGVVQRFTAEDWKVTRMNLAGFEELNESEAFNLVTVICRHGRNRKPATGRQVALLLRGFEMRTKPSS